MFVLVESCPFPYSDILSFSYFFIISINYPPYPLAGAAVRTLKLSLSQNSPYKIKFFLIYGT
jgi:hypothetical protein